MIDDEAPIRLLCRVNLEAEGIEVLEAPDGRTGLELARSRKPDAILLDVMMPGLDGWEVAEELLGHEGTRSIPIVFLTARADVRDRARGIDLGGLDYVTKPFNPVDLAPLVRDAVLLGLPPAPLCEEGCLGLCPVCGANRNEARCSCDASPPDPRWAALDALRDN